GVRIRPCHLAPLVGDAGEQVLESESLTVSSFRDRLMGDFTSSVAGSEIADQSDLKSTWILCRSIPRTRVQKKHFSAAGERERGYRSVRQGRTHRASCDGVRRVGVSTAKSRH